MEKQAEEKAMAKKRERVLKQWVRLVHGLRIRQKLQEQYGSKAAEEKGLDTGRDVKQKEDDQVCATFVGCVAWILIY